MKIKYLCNHINALGGKVMEINIIPKFLDSALTPVAKEAGERLADIVSLLFTPVVKAKAKRDKNIELFLSNLM